MWWHFWKLLNSLPLQFKAKRGIESHRVEEVGISESSELIPEWSAPRLSSCREHQPLVLTPTWLPLSQLCSPAGSPSTILPFGSVPGMASTSLWTPAGPASSIRGAERSPSSSADTESGCECAQCAARLGDPRFPTSRWHGAGLGDQDPTTSPPRTCAPRWEGPHAAEQ